MFLASSGLYVLSHSIEITKGLRRAGLTYFLFGCLSSSLFLLGSAFLYANCGITSLDPAPILDGLHYSVSTLIYSVAEVDIQPLGSTIGLSHAAILLKNKSIQKDKDPELKDLDPNFVSGFSDALSTKSSNSNSTNQSLELWGTNLISTVGVKFTRTQLAMVRLAPYQYSVIIGLLLSDGWLIFASKTSKNARLGFQQSLANVSYALFVFNKLSHYCSNSTQLRSGIRAGNRFYGLQFFTRSMPCLTELHSIFYLNGIKIIPLNIYELLTPVALAHWIMADGKARRHGLILCTDSYSVEDVVQLMNVLIIRYRLEGTLQAHRKNQYRIYIRQRSMPRLQNIVRSHMHSSMLYKLPASLR